MPKPGSVGWTLQRYMFRRDVARKVHHRYSAYRRRAERDAFVDVAHAYRELGEVRTVIDVGANIGLVTSKLLKLFPAAAVHAFEPTADTARVLHDRLAAEVRLTFNEVAVADAVGTTSFNVDNRTHGGGSNSMLSHSPHFATRARVDRYVSVTVPTTTLDAYASEHGITHIDLVKLDIEGAELRALIGAKGLLERQAIDFIVSEVRFVADYVDQPLLCDLVRHLGEKGYTVFNLYSPAESGVRQALFADAVFVSDRMRRRLHDAYGERECGWYQS